YTKALRKLQADVPPVPTPQALDVLERSLGMPPKEVFDEIDPLPLAAASLGQVYKGKYQGKKVAIKILRPGIHRVVETDLFVLGLILRVFLYFLDNHFVRSFWAIYLEYARIIREEIDFRNEEKNAERFRRNFAPFPNVVIPKVYKELTRQEVVVFEFMEGVRVDDREALASIGLTSKELLELMISTYVRMTIVHGFIHADPHPGNLLVDNQKRLVILDYGMALTFPDEMRREILRGCLAIVRDDINALVDAFYRIGMVDESANRALVRDAAQRLLSIQMRDDFEPRMVQEIADEILATFHEFPLRMPQQLVYLFRASALVEGLGMKFDKNFSAVREATPIVKRLIREIALEPEVGILDKLKQGFNAVYNIGDQLRRVIERMEREEQRIRLNSADLAQFERLVALMTRRLVASVGVGLVALTGIALGLVQQNILLIGGMGVGAAAVLLLLYVMPVRRRDSG
ncbi:MAG: AarF/UbiB family protein, partial [Candidatus Sumerlaeia bacterium]|nr:AarF/UbiB family protein [Candidatus Sumerlaeia bacterium]